MDWVTHDAPPARRLDPRAAARRDVLARRRTEPEGAELRRLPHAGGLELRCGYGVDDLLRSTRLNPQDDVRYVAARWLHVVLSTGSFDVLECHVGDELEGLRVALDNPEAPTQ